MGTDTDAIALIIGGEIKALHRPEVKPAGRFVCVLS